MKKIYELFALNVKEADPKFVSMIEFGEQAFQVKTPKQMALSYVEDILSKNDEV